MLSPQTKQRLDILRADQDTYQPASDIRAGIAPKIAGLVVGASCQGENTLMDAAAQLDKRFAIIGTIVSRPRRASDEGLPYTYYEHSDAGLAPILDDIEQHRVVQYAINPYSGFLYASKLGDYPSDYNIGDFFSSGVEPFRRLGFRTAPAVSIVSPVPDFIERFNERFPIGHAEREARKDEAVESLNWSLAQETDHYWVINRTGQAAEGAAQLIAAVTGSLHQRQNRDAEQLARQALVAIKDIPL